jgi:hypothetical protein
MSSFKMGAITAGIRMTRSLPPPPASTLPAKKPNVKIEIELPATVHKLLAQAAQRRQNADDS